MGGRVEREECLLLLRPARSSGDWKQRLNGSVLVVSSSPVSAQNARSVPFVFLQTDFAKLTTFLRDDRLPCLLAIAEKTLAEFLSKATGTAVEWVKIVGMKTGPVPIGIVAVSHNCSGVVARACGLVSIEPTKVAEILKDRPSWYRDCRCHDVLTVIPAGNGGNIEPIYMQTYASTTLASARDFCS